ncbi:MBL fold metallo-hydrolase [bacterium]|nr:MBL fold metallo-hydrolase [candidate division CSSED10-310 bacterium]
MGATGTVTGSRTAVIAGPKLDDRILVDCGLFQGLKELRLRNWNPFPMDPGSIGAVFLTHAHIDHSGYLPRLVKSGFQGPVYCTPASADLLHIMLLDSAHLQEEEARFANKTGFSKHKPALPLYDTADARAALELLHPTALHTEIRVGDRIRATFHDAGHILGAGSLRVDLMNRSTSANVLFSGDIGRFGVPIHSDPESPDSPDIIVMESTYGNRMHPLDDPYDSLASVINETISRNGVLLIPAFAVGRTQVIMYMLREMQTAGDIPKVPVYLDSPMAIRAFEAYGLHENSLDSETAFMRRKGDHPMKPDNLHFCSSQEESKALNSITNSAIIVSASGMATGGRILHHLKHRLPHARNTVLFIGYQGTGTRGRTIQEGRESVKIHGSQIPIRSRIESIQGFSAHADQDELLLWLKKFQSLPRKILLNHGESESIEALAKLIARKFRVETMIPEYLEEIEL